ncbi:gypsy retrotransposon integrase-like protein 1 [Plakobranchus ocellatus]|uniref:Gypsy retrotransposon integrase-like protein 1 n=1 Tax=Plakobranchus ocellatus TaxID=259542 RepID=A0AAV3Z2S8_9GAST|nr:gypsy retrotransposon integrase-like protein 1 [Plakobranchus ocellatus]
MATMEEIVKQADLLGYRGKKREEYLKQEFKLLAERQEKKKEAERQAREKKEEAERQERMEKEEADRKERLELEKMKLDAEMKLLQAKIEAGIIKNEPDGSSAMSSDARAKHPKLPNFQDGRDDLDIWLTRFERFAESNGWSREKWSSPLCALLTGRALDCYGRLSAEQAKDYDKVKEALMKRYDLTEDGYRPKFRTFKPAEGESPDMFIVRIVTYLDRWTELSKTDKSYEKLKDLIVREQFMDACPEDLATSLREKDLPTLERVAKEAYLFLKARIRQLCDRPRKVFQGNARPRMDSVRPLEPQKKFNGGQRAGEAKTSVADQRSCFKCKKTGHIARYCTAVDSTTKKAGAGVVVKTTEVNTAEVRKLAESLTMEVTDYLQSEEEGGMLKLASGKSVLVMTNCAALRDPEKTRSLGLPVFKGEVGGREVDVLRDTGCEGVVVRKQLVDASQLTGECCLLLRIGNTALLAEKAVISLRTPFLSGEVKALCIPDAICDVIVGNVEGAKSPEDPDMSVMVSTATTRAQAKREAVTKPLRVPDIERHVGVDREQLIKLQQEDPRILALVDAGRTLWRGRKIVSFEKARGIVYRRYQDLGRNVDVKQAVLPKPLREYVMSVAHDSITGAHLGIRRTKDKVLSNFYWPGVDGDMTRYCRSCDVCQRTVKKGIVPRVPLEKVPLMDTPFKRVAIDLVGLINSEAGNRFADAVPLREIDTESVAEALVDIYSRLGVPEEVLSDQGTQFISDCMKDVCRLLGIKQKTTTPCLPVCNGLVERLNATLKTCLRRLCNEQPRQWHRYINPLLFPYREVPQESTHFDPFELLYGRTVRGPILRELWTKEIEETDVKSSYEYVLNLRERLEDTLKIASEELEKAQGR